MIVDYQIYVYWEKENDIGIDHYNISIVVKFIVGLDLETINVFRNDCFVQKLLKQYRSYTVHCTTW